jgi:hypothetical protein
MSNSLYCLIIVLRSLQGAQNIIWPCGAINSRGLTKLHQQKLQVVPCSLSIIREVDQMKGNVVGGAYSMQQGHEQCVIGSVGKD